MSILGKIEAAEVSRSEAEFLRKQVGGFLNQLAPLGIDPENSDTYPVYTDLKALEGSKTDLNYKIRNIDKVREGELLSLKNQADSTINEINAENAKIIAGNDLKIKKFEAAKLVYAQNLATKGGIETDLKTLETENCLKEGAYTALVTSLESYFKPETPMQKPLDGCVQFDEQKGSIISKSKHFEEGSEIFILLGCLEKIRAEYASKSKEPKGDSTELQGELTKLIQSCEIIEENNNRRKMLDSFLNWQDLNNTVIELRNDYANMLSGINTGVEGLKICIDKDESSKLDIYLKYNGAYDPKYFGNESKEFRKLSSYSGTQKPLICLLLQNFLLSTKPKAMRYLWIDDVPIDNKTKTLLERMGEELGVTIIVNITGDFEKTALQNGEILIENGHCFFN